MMALPPRITAATRTVRAEAVMTKICEGNRAPASCVGNATGDANAAPLVAGVAATAVVLPIALLPVVTVATAVAFGVGVGAGVASGRRNRPGV